MNIKDADKAWKVVKQYKDTLTERNALQINTLHIPGLVSALASIQSHTITTQELKAVKDVVLALFDRRLAAIEQELKGFGVNVVEEAPSPVPVAAKPPVTAPAPKPEGIKADGK